MKISFAVLAMSVTSTAYATPVTNTFEIVNYSGAQNFAFSYNSNASSQVSETVNLNVNLPLPNWDQTLGLLKSVDLSVSASPSVTIGIGTIRTNPSGCLIYGVCYDRNVNIVANAPLSLNLSNNFGSSTSPNAAVLVASTSVPSLPPGVFRTFTTQPGVLSLPVAAGLSVSNAQGVINQFQNVSLSINSSFGISVDASKGLGSPTLVNSLSGQVSNSGTIFVDYSIDTLKLSPSKANLLNISDTLDVISKSFNYASIAASAGSVLDGYATGLPIFTNGGQIGQLGMDLIDVSRNITNTTASDLGVKISSPLTTANALLDSYSIATNTLRGISGDRAALASAIFSSISSVTKALSLIISYEANDPPDSNYKTIDDLSAKTLTISQDIQSLIDDPNFSSVKSELIVLNDTLKLAIGNATAIVAYERYEGALQGFDFVSAALQATEVSKSLELATIDESSYLTSLNQALADLGPNGLYPLNSSDLGMLHQVMSLLESQISSNPSLGSAFSSDLILQPSQNLQDLLSSVDNEIDTSFSQPIIPVSIDPALLFDITSDQLVNPDGSPSVYSSIGSVGSNSGEESGQVVPEPSTIWLLSPMILVYILGHRRIFLQNRRDYNTNDPLL